MEVRALLGPSPSIVRTESTLTTWRMSTSTQYRWVCSCLQVRRGREPADSLVLVHSLVWRPGSGRVTTTLRRRSLAVLPDLVLLMCKRRLLGSRFLASVVLIEFSRFR